MSDDDRAAQEAEQQRQKTLAEERERNRREADKIERERDKGSRP